MSKIKIFIVLFFVFFFSIALEAQSINERKIDSLLVLCDKEQQDTIKVDLLNKIVYLSKSTNLDLCGKSNSKLYALSKKNNYQKGIGHYYFNEGEQDARKGNTEAALLKVTKSAAIFLKIKSSTDFALAQYYKANLLLMLNRGNEGYEIVSKSLKRFQNSDHYKELSYFYFFYGIYYQTKNDIANSLFYLNKAVFNAQKVNFLPILLNSYDCIVGIYSKSKRWELALEYSNLEIETLAAIEASEGAMLAIRKGVVFSKNSNIYRELANYSKALTLANLALKNAIKSKNKEVINNCLNLISLIHFENKNYQKSIAISNSVLEDHSKKNYFALQVLGKNYFMLGQYEKSLTYLKKSLLNEYNSNTSLTEYYLDKYSIYEDLAETEFALKNYKSSCEFGKIFYQSKIDDLSKDKQEIISELETRFNVKIKDLAVEQLTVEKQQRILALSRAKFKLIVLLLLFLMAAIILGFVLYFSIKNRKQTKIISIKNSELEKSKNLIEESLKMKNILLKEIHHRVKNNLQMVSSLLNIQARQDKIITIKEFLEKAETRIAVLALIHESLCESENYEKVCLQEYLGNLVTNLLDVLGCNRLNVSLSTKEIFLDIQTSVSLGLIINELVCNSIKHASLDASEGEIVIRIRRISQGNYELFFADNGTGTISRKKSKKSLGLNLVEVLVLQIHGTMSSSNAPGLTYEINFKDVV